MAPAGPSIIYGTAWKEERTRDLTLQALAAGLLAIDTANQRKHYVEAAVGEAIAACGRPRSSLFVQTKFTYARGQDHRLPYEAAAPPSVQVAQSFASSCTHLGTDYIDSYLLHGPWASEGWADPDRAVWAAMERLHRAGQIGALGVSNVSAAQLGALIVEAQVAPTIVQNRCYARTGWDREVRALCRAHGITYQGFSLLTANRRELALPTLVEAAARAGVNPEQFVFALARGLGITPLTGSSSAIHLADDLAAIELELDSTTVAHFEALTG